MKTLFRASLAAAALAFPLRAAHADITIGVSLPLTGPASGLGIPSKNGLALWPLDIGGEKLKLLVADDAGDPAQAAKLARRFVDEDKADLIIGSVATGAAIAIAGVAAQAQTVQLALSPVELPDGKGEWTFRMPQSIPLMATGVVKHMKELDIRTVGVLGYADPYGEGWLKAMASAAKGYGIRLTAIERFGRADPSVAAQAQNLVAAKPDAILIVASGSGAAMPHKTLVERGYKGKIYQTHGAASRELIKQGGKDVEGGLVIAGLAVLPEALPDYHPSKKMAVSFVDSYEKKYGQYTRNQFAASIYDAQIVLQHVVPAALRAGKPGTPAFRAALKSALESSGNIVITQGVIHFTQFDHFGLGALSRMMLTVDKGEWKYAELR